MRFKEMLRSRVVVLRLRQLGAIANAGGAGAVQCSLLLLDLSLVRIRLDQQQQLPLLHDLPFLDRDGHDFARDFGRNLHLDLGLDLAGRGDQLRNGLAESLLRGDRLRFFPLFRDDRRHDHDDDQNGDADDDGTLFPRTRGFLSRATEFAHRMDSNPAKSRGDACVDANVRTGRRLQIFGKVSTAERAKGRIERPGPRGWE